MHRPSEHAPARRTALKGLGASLLCLRAVGRSGALGNGPRESRAIHNEGFNWLDRREAQRMIERVAQAGFNVLVTCVWHGSGATWPSKAAPLAESFSGGDPFAELLDFASRRGVEVHAWFTVALRQRDFLTEFADAGAPAQKFEIHRPEFRAFIARTVQEFVQRYPVQGVNLDYVRAGGISLSRYAQRDYDLRTGRSLLLDRALVTDAARSSIQSWQETAITDVIRTISTQVRAARPGIVVSADAAPWYAPYRLEGQNGVRWADESLIDVLYSMNYQDVLDLAALNAVRDSMKRPAALVPIVSNYVGTGRSVASRPARDLTALLGQAREVSRDNGVAVYLYNMLDDAQVRGLRTGAFADAATPAWVR